MTDTRLETEMTTPQGSTHEHVAAAPAHAGHGMSYWRHLGEMVIAMWVGMAIGGIVWGAVLGALGSSLSEARVRYPELYLFVMAFDMTVPMVAWMRYRGHGWRSCAEMSAAMVVPGVLLLCLYWFGATDGPACGMYCALMIVAMAAVMLVRRDEYSR